MCWSCCCSNVAQFSNARKNSTFGLRLCLCPCAALAELTALQEAPWAGLGVAFAAKRREEQWLRQMLVGESVAMWVQHEKDGCLTSLMWAAQKGDAVLLHRIFESEHITADYVMRALDIDVCRLDILCLACVHGPKS